MRGIGRGLSYHHVLLYKVTFVKSLIKRREVVDGARRIRSEKLREHKCKEGYAMSVDVMRVELDRENNVGRMWEWVQLAMIERAREVCDSVRLGGKNPKSVWWIDKIKSTVRRKKPAWKGVLGTRDEDAGERCWKLTKKKEKG